MQRGCKTRSIVKPHVGTTRTSMRTSTTIGQTFDPDGRDTDQRSPTARADRRTQAPSSRKNNHRPTRTTSRSKSIRIRDNDRVGGPTTRSIAKPHRSVPHGLPRSGRPRDPDYPPPPNILQNFDRVPRSSRKAAVPSLSFRGNEENHPTNDPNIPIPTRPTHRTTDSQTNQMTVRAIIFQVETDQRNGSDRINEESIQTFEMMPTISSHIEFRTSGTEPSRPSERNRTISS